MDDQLIRAKELFTSYDGSTLHMYREGQLEEYKQYNIPKQLEIDWFNELINQYTQELSIKDWNAVYRLDSIANHYKDERILRNVVAFTSRNVMSSDSIVKLMYAEGIIEIINKTKDQIQNDLRTEAYKTTYLILEDIINKPLIIDPGHELENYNLKDKKSLNDRAKRSIEKIKNDFS
ncbi:hypothetical protein D7Z26_00200 [Cohnella endophytica]|uniref:Uncharacterized protein n=1 Tax=Cohnella endophytica TaxID=2419778 RepID=A0A494Y6P2_9BACL|nr:hypothetical protein [Cohnella endophytica]RKP57974.1 hypothetical protein D7Z26_00200 [Cohnella endophytica]